MRSGPRPPRPRYPRPPPGPPARLPARGPRVASPGAPTRTARPLKEQRLPALPWPGWWSSRTSLRRPGGPGDETRSEKGARVGGQPNLRAWGAARAPARPYIEDEGPSSVPRATARAEEVLPPPCPDRRRASTRPLRHLPRPWALPAGEVVIRWPISGPHPAALAEVQEPRRRSGGWWRRRGSAGAPPSCRRGAEAACPRRGRDGRIAEEIRRAAGRA